MEDMKPDKEAPNEAKGSVLTKYLTTDQLAVEIGVHRTTLAKWRMERRGPPFTRLGNRILYNVESFHHWLNKGEVDPLPEPTGSRRRA